MSVVLTISGLRVGRGFAGTATAGASVAAAPDGTAGAAVPDGAAGGDLPDVADGAVLRGVDLALSAGRILGLAGESGSGKTMTGLAVLGLLPPGLRATGSIRLGPRQREDDPALRRPERDEIDLLTLDRRRLRAVRGARVAMVFQDPATSLHPMLSVGAQLTDHLRHHLRLSRPAALDRAAGLLQRVQVPDPWGALRRYPHQFSGGQRQRIAIAGALACGPEVLIADEPTTALDVTVQAGVLRLLRHLADTEGLAVLLVTHDLGVLSAVADEVAVMRHGRVVEIGEREQVFRRPAHPYTRDLLAALPGAVGGVDSLADVHALAATAEQPR